MWVGKSSFILWTWNLHYSVVINNGEVGGQHEHRMSSEFILTEACSNYTLATPFVGMNDTQHMTLKLINIEIYMCVYVMCVHIDHALLLPVLQMLGLSFSCSYGREMVPK